MPENQLADNFYRRPGPACIRCSMPSEIMRADFNPDLSAGAFDNLPGSGVADVKNSFLRGNVFESDIFPESAGNFFLGIKTTSF